MLGASLRASDGGGADGVKVSRWAAVAASSRLTRSELGSDWGVRSRSRSRSRGGGVEGSSRFVTGSGVNTSWPAESAAAFALVLRGRGLATRFFLVSPELELARADDLSSSVFGGMAMSG